GAGRTRQHVLADRAVHPRPTAAAGGAAPLRGDGLRTGTGCRGGAVSIRDRSGRAGANALPPGSKRRSMMRFVSSRIVFAVAVLNHAPALPAQPAPPTPDAALQMLNAGNERFAQDKLAPRKLGSDRRAELAKAQHPFAVVLACADSRVSPELIFDQGLG